MTQQAFGRYDFGLSAEEEDRAARLHRESIVVDLLYWGPLGYRCFTEEMIAAQRGAFASGGAAAVASVSRDQVLQLTGGDAESSFRELWDASGVTAGSRD